MWDTKMKDFIDFIVMLMSKWYTVLCKISTYNLQRTYWWYKLLFLVINSLIIGRSEYFSHYLGNKGSEESIKARESLVHRTIIFMTLCCQVPVYSLATTRIHLCTDCRRLPHILWCSLYSVRISRLLFLVDRANRKQSSLTLNGSSLPECD